MIKFMRKLFKFKVVILPYFYHHKYETTYFLIKGRYKNIHKTQRKYEYFQELITYASTRKIFSFENMLSHFAQQVIKHFSKSLSYIFNSFQDGIREAQLWILVLLFKLELPQLKKVCMPFYEVAKFH